MKKYNIKKLTSLNKRKTTFLVLILVLYSGAFLNAQNPIIEYHEPVVIETGFLLFIPVPKKCDVFINGEFQGVTPLLLPSLRAGSAILEIRNNSHVNRTELQVKPGIAGLKVYEPEMVPQGGALSITTNPSGAEIIIENIHIGRTPILESGIRTGTYTVTAFLDGYVPIRQSLEIGLDQKVHLNLNLSEGYPLRIDPNPPEGSTISIKTGKGIPYLEQLYDTKEDIILPAGVWEITLKGPNYNPLTEIINISKESNLFSFLPEYHYGEIVINKLKPQTTVFMDGMDVTVTVEKGSIRVETGKHVLVVIEKGYLPYRTEIVLEQNEVLQITPLLQRDPVLERKALMNLGIPVAISGLIISAGAWGFNTDSVALAFTDNYSDYSIYKYTTFGIMGAGLICSAIGGIIIAKAK